GDHRDRAGPLAAVRRHIPGPGTPRDEVCGHRDPLCLSAGSRGHPLPRNGLLFVPGARDPHTVNTRRKANAMSETMLEKMEDFFDSRLDMYDEHQLNCIDSARDFLQFTAECLPPR